MAYSTITKASAHFDSKIYLGSSNAVTVSGLEFQPDLVWVKDRDNGNNHVWVDAVRGAGKFIQSNLNNAEVNNSSQSISAFTSDGFTTGTANPANESASTTKGFISWNWKAGTTSGITQGGASITPTSYSFNATAGFSIIKYTGTGSTATIPHGLGVKPDLMIIKNLGATENWMVYHRAMDTSGSNTPEDYYLLLNSNNGRVDEATVWNDTAPTANVFTVGSHAAVNQSGNAHVAYCFRQVPGYSRIGSYIGNGNNDGPFVNCGFKPAFVIAKRITGNGYIWYLRDEVRSPINPMDQKISVASNGVESNDGNNKIDFYSNGFKMRHSLGQSNENSYGYIFWCFGQALVGSNNIPTTAR